MSEFILLFSMDITTKGAQPNPEQMAIYMEQWDKWIKTITQKNKLSGGNHLSNEGKVLTGENKIAKGPYVQKKEAVAGYIIVNVKNFTEAVSIAKRCPILNGKNTSVEVRKVAET